MRPALIVVCVFIFTATSFGQNSFDAVVRDSESGEPLVGATALIKGTSIGGTSDQNGQIRIHDIPDGEQIVEFSFLGYRPELLRIKFPYAGQRTVVLLQAIKEELEEIVITSTRSSRTIADIPTRVEFIAGEELNEKANMKPGDIRMLLSESTGIQTQQTSPTSANASIRIQGLDGRYTQILKDGFPLYAGFSGGLGLLQTPPLDLKQVEVIKGSSSTLYGGGAIAGMVNLVSRTPSKEQDLRFLINGTSAKGLDLSGFYSKKFDKVGLTVFTSRNTSEPYDPADIGLTAIPKFTRYTFNPKLYVDFDEKTSLVVGINFATEDRIGGDIKYIEGTGDATHSYYESNISHRYATQLSFMRKLGESSSINFKNSINHFDRVLEIPAYRFDGVQNSTFTELNFVKDGEMSEWIAGVNLWTEDFSEKPTTTQLRDYTQTTFGAFVQNNLSISEKIKLETGLRGDYVIDYGFAFLPRVSLLYKMSESFSSRAGGGFGYKTPTIFTEESERRQFQNVLPISKDRNKLEKSYGANWDFNYRTTLGEIGLSINHLFFYTYLNDPLVLVPTNNENYEFVNLSGFTDSKGTETNVKIEFADFKLFVGYTFTDTKIHDGGTSVRNPLTAKHRLNNVLMYEADEKWKIGLEAYYFSKQRLTDSSYGNDYWICGFMVEKLWEKFSVFINFENFLDARQTGFDSIYTGSITNPVFRDIYAPVDGFVINGGLKLNL
jgi:outer membrane receptor for ferrienterochelin and colicins